MIIKENEEIIMKKYDIYTGLGGGFGGAHLVAEAEEFENQEAAVKYAYECALKEYQSYEGYYSIVSYGNILDCPENYGLEDSFTEKDIQKEIDDQISYCVKEME